jgi:protein dispatched 1
MAIEKPQIWNTYSALFDTSVKKGSSYVKFMRTNYNLAGPLEVNGVRFADKSDRREEQKEFYKEYQFEVNEWIEGTFPADHPNGFMAEMFSTIIRSKAFSDTVNEDTSYAIFSVIFVFIYFIIHLRSLFLAFIGISIILFSFSVTVCITEGILRITYFSSLHSLAIFIVLGIAADDIFVFIDAWR